MAVEEQMPGKGLERRRDKRESDAETGVLMYRKINNMKVVGRKENEAKVATSMMGR